MVFSQNAYGIKYYKGNGTLEPQNKSNIFERKDRGSVTPFFVDYDNDDDKDLFLMDNGFTIGNSYTTPFMYFKNRTTDNKWRFSNNDSVFIVNSMDSTLYHLTSSVHQTMGDFDLDSDLDLIVWTKETIYKTTQSGSKQIVGSEGYGIVYSNIGKFQYELVDTIWRNSTNSITKGHTSVTSGDLNNDGFLDVVLFSDEDGVSIAWGEGDVGVTSFNGNNNSILKSVNFTQTQSELTVINDEVISKIEVYSTTGKRLHYSENSKKVNTTSLATGLYFIKVFRSDGLIGTNSFMKD